MNSDFNTKLNEINLKLLKALKQVETEETENAKLKREIEAKLKLEQELKELQDKIPVKRLGTPEDIAKLVYTLTIDNNYITGQNIIIDGGFSCTTY